MVEFLVALVPSVGVLLLFWYVIRALIEGDRRERLAQARLDREALQARELSESVTAREVLRESPEDGEPGAGTRPVA